MLDFLYESATWETIKPLFSEGLYYTPKASGGSTFCYFYWGWIIELSTYETSVIDTSDSDFSYLSCVIDYTFTFLALSLFYFRLFPTFSTRS